MVVCAPVTGSSLPAIACDGAANFVVAWESGAQDGDATGVFARGFDASGAALGGEFQVNTYTTGNQRFASVSSNASGEVVVSWASADQDGDDDGVFAQRLLLLVAGVLRRAGHSRAVKAVIDAGRARA